MVLFWGVVVCDILHCISVGFPSKHWNQLDYALPLLPFALLMIMMENWRNAGNNVFIQMIQISFLFGATGLMMIRTDLDYFTMHIIIAFSVEILINAIAYFMMAEEFAVWNLLGATVTLGCGSYLVFPHIKPDILVPVLMYVTVLGVFGWRASACYNTKLIDGGLIPSGRVLVLGAVAFMYLSNLVLGSYRFVLRQDTKFGKTAVEAIYVISMHFGHLLLALSAKSARIPKLFLDDDNDDNNQTQAPRRKQQQQQQQQQQKEIKQE